MFENILVTGGAGYIGSILISQLLNQGYNVRILDSLIYGKSGIENQLSKNNVELIEGDIRNNEIAQNAVKGIDCVIHLAAIVGDPLCKKIPKAAKEINEIATQNFVKICKKAKVSRFIYASTCSNYGASKTIVDENSPLQWLSLYSETKVKSEENVLQEKSLDFEPCVLRFATAFGLSPRMRFDLLLQEFIRDAVIEKLITIFGPHHWRPLVHVNDISKSCILAIEKTSELISGEIYNVGANKQNYTKLQLVEMIQKKIPECKIHTEETKNDPRNYRVSFDKIKKQLGFYTSKTVQEGIEEIFDAIQKNGLDPKESDFSNLSKMTNKVYAFNQ